MQRELIEIESSEGAWVIRGATRAIMCRSLSRAIQIGHRRAQRRFRKHGRPIAVAVPVGSERVLVGPLG